MLAGRISQRGDTLVVGAELIDVSSGTQLWGDRFNRPMASIFQLEEDISRAITENLKLRLTGEEEAVLARRDTESTEAYQFYLRGRYHWNRRTSADLQKAVGYFRQAIEKDSSYALAYAGLAESYAIFDFYGVTTGQEAFPTALAAANKALDLDDTLAEAHNALAFA